MEHRKQGNGLETFLEHWGLLLAFVPCIVAVQFLMFIKNLHGRSWIYFSIASMVLLVSGAALILYAKLPVYRSGRFFTFGVKSVPAHLAGYYRWGWRVFFFGVVLSLCVIFFGHA